MNKQKAFLPLVIIFLVLNGLILAGRSFLDNMGFDRDFLIVANLILFFITLLSFLFQQRGINAANPNAFVRSVYAGLMLKIFICMIAVLVYGLSMKGKINKPSLFTSFGLYILYTAVEVTVLMKLSKKKKNA